MAYAGSFNEPIEIWRFIKEQNEYGELVTKSEKVRDSRAKVQHLSGSRTLRNNEIIYPYSKSFVLRIHECIDENMMIKWYDHFYRILSIDRDRELQHQVIVCEVVNE